jgi:glycosyltransferase involved in cell wall biosynthesis
MVIRFLIANAFAVGGTVRTTFMVAGQLARDHEVEVVSVYRLGDTQKLELDPRVRLRTLTDLRPRSLGRIRRAAAAVPSRLIHRDDIRHHRFNLLTDAALLRFLRATREGVLIGTRPGLNLAIARHGRREAIRIGQDHMNLDYRPGLLAAMADSYPRLDAVSALTAGTTAGYRALLGEGVRVECIPNPAPAVSGRRADPGSRVVAAAGALSRRKGFDRLLEAWARLAPSHPGWRLRIFGDGQDRAELEALIDALGIRPSAALCGHSPRLLEELQRASVFAITSRKEGFPMVIVEAMALGLPVVAYDFLTGPGDIITDGVDGFLVPEGRTRLLADALDTLMRDAGRRRRFGEAALATVDRYRIDAIGARWNTLFEELSAARAGGATASRRDAATARARA